MSISSWKKIVKCFNFLLGWWKVWFLTSRKLKITHFLLIKTAINKLNNLYYNCIFKLFKLNFVNMNSIQINLILSNYNLNYFLHRIIYKLMCYVFKIKNLDFSPFYLKECLNFVELKRNYNLRSNGKLIIPHQRYNSKYGEYSFRNFFIILIVLQLTD